MNKLTQALAVLIVEDLESDAQLLVRLLKKAGYEIVYEQVETAGQMRVALEKQNWDIVVSDYQLPQFDGRAALKLLQEMGRDIPFIIVSGTIGEETAVSMLKAGAHDYLVKGDLARFVPAVTRELDQSEIRRGRKQAEESLAASEAELRALFASMQDVVLVIDREGVYRKVAPTNLELLAIPPAELLGKNLREVFSIQQAETFIGVVQHVLVTKQTSRIEYEIPIGGQPMWFEASISSMDADNTLWVAHDVTARKQAEEALAASETKLRALVEQVPAVVYTESADTRETIYISPQVEKLTGYTPAEWIADRYLWKKMVHHDDLDAVVAEDDRTTITHEPFYIDYRILARDGRVLWIHDESVLIQNQDGTPLFWQGVIHDITERKQAENEVKERTEEMELVNALNEAVNRGDSLHKIIELIAKDLGQISLGKDATIYLLSPDGKDLVMQYLSLSPTLIKKVEQLIGRPLPRVQIPIKEGGYFHLALQSEQGLIATDPKTIQNWMREFIETKSLPVVVRGMVRKLIPQIYKLLNIRSTLVLPLISDKKVIGLLDVSSSDILTEKDLIRIRKISGQVTAVILRKQAEEALRESEERFHTLYDNTTIGLYRTTPDGRILMLNPAGVRMLGFDSFGEIAKRNLDETGFEPDYSRQEFRKKLEGEGVIIGLESKWIRKDGTKIFVRESAKVFRNKNGEALYYDGSFEDITERKQAEKSLREREEQYRTLVEQIPGFVFLDDANVQGHTLYVSPQIETILGFTPQEWQESSPGLWRKQVHPDDLEWVHAGYMRCFLYGEAFNAEYRISASDGRLRWVHDQAKILRDENGKPRLILGVTNDITERKQAEEQLRKLSRAVDQNPASIVITDLLGNIEYVNPKFSQVTGYSFAEALGKNPRILKSGNATREEYKKLWDTILSGDVWQGELLNKKKNGETYWEFATIAPVFGEDGKITNFLALKENITERKQAEENIHQRVKELELLYQSGLALSQLLNPKEIGQKILELLKEKLGWHHTRIRLYHPQDDSLELLDFNQPGLQDVVERQEVVDRFQTLITGSGQGLSGWVIQHGLPVRSGDVSNDPRYVEAYLGIRSGLYVPMKLGERIVGVIGIESEQPDAFNEEDERLIITLANQAASAFENARLFEETRQRVMELETLNRISLVLRAVSNQNEMLSIVLDEALTILKTSHGSILLYNKTTDALEKTIMRGWTAQVAEPPQNIHEGIAGKVFASGEIHISRDFASDPDTHAASRDLIPPNWGGVCLPIRTTQQTLGVMNVSVPSGREFSKDDIRLLATLSEMTGAALQRMQLHEQTVRRLEQLHALRAVDQAIASNLDMRLTLNILLDHTVSQLGVDAADILLLPSGSNLLELTASRGFHSHLLNSTSLSDSFAVHAIMQHRIISAMDFEIVALRENPNFAKFWKEEGFVCYWCVPLIVKGEVKGVLEVYSRKTFTPDAEWLEFLESLAGQAAITIDTSQLFENLQRANLDLSLAYDATIEGWSRAMDLRDHETEGHTLRVTDLTMKLARAMRISESQLTAIRRGALLHDIGKMGVPDTILLKEGVLTEEEWVRMRQHPQLAHDMLAPIAYLNDAIDIPYCHHEKWDGTGYPQGLKGDRIPLIARIFAVVDVWDALTNDRTYRKKWSKQKTLEYIKEQSGRHFDPQVVDVFLKHISLDS